MQLYKLVFNKLNVPKNILHFNRNLSIHMSLTSSCILLPRFDFLCLVLDLGIVCKHRIRVLLCGKHAQRQLRHYDV